MLKRSEPYKGMGKEGTKGDLCNNQLFSKEEDVYPLGLGLK